MLYISSILRLQFCFDVEVCYKFSDFLLSNHQQPVIIFRNAAFFAGSILAVLVLLTVIDEDTLNVQHVVGLMTILGLIVTLTRVLIPDEVRVIWYT